MRYNHLTQHHREHLPSTQSAAAATIRKSPFGQSLEHKWLRHPREAVGHILAGGRESTIEIASYRRLDMKMTTLLGVALALLLASPGKSSCQTAAPEPPQVAAKAADMHYPCSESDIAHYTARRATGPIRADGLLDEPDCRKRKNRRASWIWPRASPPF